MNLLLLVLAFVLTPMLEQNLRQNRGSGKRSSGDIKDVLLSLGDQSCVHPTNS